MTILPILMLSLPPAPPAIDPVPAALASAPRMLVAPEEFPDLGYTYAEASYVSLDSDALNETIDGWELLGSFQLPLMNFFLQGSARQLSGNTDLDLYKLGAGYHIGFIPRLDAYGIVSYQHVGLDAGFGTSNEDAVAAELGVRFALMRNLELNGRGQWADMGDRDIGYGVGARFYMTERFSLGAYYDKIGNDDQLMAGVRVEL